MSPRFQKAFPSVARHALVPGRILIASCFAAESAAGRSANFGLACMHLA